MEELVKKAIENLPLRIKKIIDNTVVCVEEEPTLEQLEKVKIKDKYQLLGLYEGIPRNVWGRGMGNNLPDKITLFTKAIKRNSNPQEREKLIKKVIRHEIAHHFGFDEKKARELEKGL